MYLLGILWGIIEYLSPNILPLVGSISTYPLTLKQGIHKKKSRVPINFASHIGTNGWFLSLEFLTEPDEEMAFASPAREIREAEMSGSFPFPLFLLLRPILQSSSSTGLLSFLLPSSFFPFH